MENNIYERTLLEKVKDIEFALKYYIKRNRELENENKLYKEMYENRVNEYLKERRGKKYGARRLK